MCELAFLFVGDSFFGAGPGGKWNLSECAPGEGTISTHSTTGSAPVISWWTTLHSILGGGDNLGRGGPRISQQRGRRRPVEDHG